MGGAGGAEEEERGAVGIWGGCKSKDGAVGGGFCVCCVGLVPLVLVGLLWLQHPAHGRIYLWEAVNAMGVV